MKEVLPFALAAVAAGLAPMRPFRPLVEAFPLAVVDRVEQAVAALLLACTDAEDIAAAQRVLAPDPQLD